MKDRGCTNQCGGIPQLYTLEEAANAFGSSGVTVSALRREVHAGRLKAYRTRPGSTAKILIKLDDVLEWLEEHAGARAFVSRSDARDKSDRGRLEVTGKHTAG